ncbi:MAG: aldo/keto reductase, partial [Candidatus Aminicenantes bacterium]|nr:aldo/keto reductase [Candidatus Aminicenantes bacterium]
MRKKTMDRREFIKTGVVSAAALGGLSIKGLHSNPLETAIGYDSKGILCRPLGKTGVQIPLIVFGGGSRFCTVKDPEESIQMLTYALDHGFYYWDTAHDYVYDGVVSEERYGMALKERRKEVFLSTKVSDRTYDGAMRHVEESLKRLKTSQVDLLQIHDVRSLEDVDAICAKANVYAALQKLKAEKVTRFIGFTGHSDAEAMRVLAER